MWDKISKVQAQVIACILIIIFSFTIAFYAAIYGIPKSAELIINKVMDIALVAAVAWLLNKINQPKI